MFICLVGMAVGCDLKHINLFYHFLSILGLFLYELVTRREICFDEEGRHLDELRFTYKIIMGGRPLIEDTLPQECNSLICGCWSQDPIERFEIKQVVSKLKEITEEDFNCN